MIALCWADAQQKGFIMNDIAAKRLAEVENSIYEISKWLKDNANPHYSVVVTDNSAKLVCSEQRIPIKEND